MTDGMQGLLEVARDWKHHKLGCVHPDIGRLLNMTLHAAGEDCVPHARNTDPRRPSLAQMIRSEQARACGSENGRAPDLTRTLRTNSKRGRAAGVQ